MVVSAGNFIIWQKQEDCSESEASSSSPLPPSVSPRRAGVTCVPHYAGIIQNQFDLFGRKRKLKPKGRCAKVW